MARRTYVHVGPPKTGTTYLQAGWRAQRPRLLGEGLLFPGKHPADQFRACTIALEHTTFTSRMDEGRSSLWNEFLAQIAEHHDDALISSEFYARADGETAKRIIAQLREVSDEVHVVLTVRDLGRQVLASWQQSVKRGSYRTLGSFWRKYHDAEERPWKFWRNQDVPALAQRWIDAGADAVTLVVVGAPGASRNQIWHDMCDVLGVSHAPVPAPSRSNSSLGAVEIEVLRRLNKRLPDDRDRVRAANLTSKFYSDRLAALGLPRVPVRVSEELAAQVRVCADEQVAQLREMSAAGAITVVGDLDALHSRLDAQPIRPDEATVADACMRLMAAMVPDELDARERAAEQAAEIRRLHQQLGVRPSLRRIVRRTLRLAD